MLNNTVTGSKIFHIPSYNWDMVSLTELPQEVLSVIIEYVVYSTL